MVHQRSKKSLERRRNLNIEQYGLPVKPKYYDGYFASLRGKKITPVQNLTSQAKRNQALKNLERECNICGWAVYPDALIIHHADKNRLNNDRSNLVVLCRNCHFLVHRNVLQMERGQTGS